MTDIPWWIWLTGYVLIAIVLGIWFLRILENNDLWRRGYGFLFEAFEGMGHVFGLPRGFMTKFFILSSIILWPIGLLIPAILHAIGRDPQNLDD